MIKHEQATLSGNFKNGSATTAALIKVTPSAS